jgi:hypothetical protein
MLKLGSLSQNLISNDIKVSRFLIDKTVHILAHLCIEIYFSLQKKNPKFLFQRHYLYFERKTKQSQWYKIKKKYTETKQSMDQEQVKCLGH